MGDRNATLPALPSGWTDRLFMRMSARYGSKWSDLWRGMPIEEVKAEWGEALRTFSGTSIRFAIEHAGAWPPTLPEFVALCREAPAPPVRFADPVPTLPREAERILTPEERRQRIAELKAMTAKWQARPTAPPNADAERARQLAALSGMSAARAACTGTAATAVSSSTSHDHPTAS